MSNEILKIRRSSERGQADHGWLNSAHTFSFGDYSDPNFMGFRTLRVINEDRVDPEKGFGKHPHRDMEIISYVIDGELEHEDSMGNGSIITQGDIQVMSAGSGVAHSEFNPSAEKPVHFLQIWIHPNEKNLKPTYQQMSLKMYDQQFGIFLIVGSEANESTLKINQDVKIYFGRLKKELIVNFSTSLERGVWIQVIKGKLKINQQALEAGDGLSAENVTQLSLRGETDAEFIIFDLEWGTAP